MTLQEWYDQYPKSMPNTPIDKIHVKKLPFKGSLAELFNLMGTLKDSGFEGEVTEMDNKGSFTIDVYAYNYYPGGLGK